MENRRIIFILLIIVLAVTIVSCKGKGGFKKLFSKEDEIEIIRSDEDFEFEITEDDGMRKTVLYFKDKQGLLVPLMRKIPWEEGIGKLALKNMVDSPELRESLRSTGLLPIIPTGTEIRGMTIDNDTGLCKVDFTEEVLNYETEKDEENLIKGVVYTLTEFQTIDQVQFLVEGEIVPTFKFGSDTSKPIRRENINLVGNLDEQRSKVVVYYKGNNFEEDFEYFVPVTIPTLAPVPNIYTALETLFDGAPDELGLSSGIPQGASFHGVDIKDGVAYVDISFDYGEPPNDGQVFNNMAKNIGLTLSEFGDIERVELLIDGKTLEEAGIDIYIDSTIPAFANEY
ncbi:MAG: GerMN domain-containing protein [Tissierellia bacterium]|nr:GerMN domain-containing protein [Tissierellia bacterium]